MKTKQVRKNGEVVAVRIECAGIEILVQADQEHSGVDVLVDSIDGLMTSTVALMPKSGNRFVIGRPNREGDEKV